MDLDRLRDRSQSVQLNGWECYVVNLMRARDQLLELQELRDRHEVNVDTAGFPLCSAFIAQVQKGPDFDPELWKVQVGVTYPTLDIFTTGAEDLQDAKKVLTQLVQQALLQALDDHYHDSTSV